MPKLPSKPMEEREKITFSIIKKYSSELVPILIKMEATGNKSEEICRSLVLLNKIMQVPEISYAIQQYIAFDTMYENNCFSQLTEKNEMFSHFLKNKTSSLGETENKSISYNPLPNEVKSKIAIDTLDGYSNTYSRIDDPMRNDESSFENITEDNDNSDFFDSFAMSD